MEDYPLLKLAFCMAAGGLLAAGTLAYSDKCQTAEDAKNAKVIEVEVLNRETGKFEKDTLIVLPLNPSKDFEDAVKKQIEEGKVKVEKARSLKR